MLVIGIMRKADRTTLHCRDQRSTDQVCVDCREVMVDTGKPVTVRLGDQVWWQGPYVLWTPDVTKNSVFDIKLPKLGYSHDSSHDIEASK